MACGGASCLYNSTDFKTWSYVGHAFGTGKGATWEMPDIFPLEAGSDQLFYKVGMENGTSYWTTGTFDEAANVFVLAPGMKGLGDQTQRADYGTFYSSKTFAGAAEKLLIGWVGEEGGPMKQWAGIQSIPRVITPDPESPGRVLFNPVQALTSLRIKPSSLLARSLAPGSATELSGSGTQRDITANFSGPFSIGQRFGLAVLADGKDDNDMTTALVLITSATEGVLSVGPHSGPFRLPKSGPLSLRVIVDKSVVEAFAGSGRCVVTRRVYPGTAQVDSFVVNRGTGTVALASVEAFEMKTPTPPSEHALRQHASMQH